MHNVLRMRGRQPFGELRAQSQDLFLRQRPRGQLVAQRHAWHILHHQKVISFLGAEFIDRFDVRMV